MGKFIHVFLSLEIATLFVFSALVSAGIPFGIKAFAIVSSSMEPTLPKGSLVYVDQSYADARRSEIAEGDCIAFTINQGQTVVTHRVIAADDTNGAFITKGDANRARDAAPVFAEALVGKVVGCIPFLGSAFTLERTTVVAAVAAVLALNCVLLVVQRLTAKKPY